MPDNNNEKRVPPTREGSHQNGRTAKLGRFCVPAQAVKRHALATPIRMHSISRGLILRERCRPQTRTGQQPTRPLAAQWNTTGKRQDNDGTPSEGRGRGCAINGRGGCHGVGTARQTQSLQAAPPAGHVALSPAVNVTGSPPSGVTVT